MLKITRQLAREFWLPFTIAIAWTAYSWQTEAVSARNLKLLVSAFGPAFFLASWGVSQWYRVRKQQHVDSGLERIQAQVSYVLSEIESRTTDILGSMTGGDSVCYLTGIPTTLGLTQPQNAWAVHHGRYPIYDVHIRVVDVDIFDALEKANAPFQQVLKESETHSWLSSLTPGHATEVSFVLLANPADSARNFNVFYTARNGSFMQALRFRKVNGTWLRATKVEMNGTKYQEVQAGYPVSATGEVDWEALA